MKNKKIFSIFAILMLAVMIAALCVACNPKQGDQVEPEVVNSIELSNSIKGTYSSYIAGDSQLEVNQMEHSFINRGIEGFANNLASAGFYKSKSDALINLMEYVMISVCDSSNSAKLDMYEDLINQAFALGFTRDDVGVVVECMLNAVIDIDVEGALAEAEEKSLAYLATVSNENQPKYENYAKLANVYSRIGNSFLNEDYVIHYSCFDKIEENTYSLQDYNTIKEDVKSATSYDMVDHAELMSTFNSSGSITFESAAYTNMVEYVNAVVSFYYTNAEEELNRTDYNEALYNKYQSAKSYSRIDGNKLYEIEKAFFKNGQRIAESGMDELRTILDEYKLLNPDSKIFIPQNATEVTAAWFVSTSALVKGELADMYYEAIPYEGYRNAKMLQWKIAEYRNSIAKTPEDGTYIISAEELRTTFVPTLKALAVEFFNIAGLASNVTTNIVNIAESNYSESDVESTLGTIKQSVASINSFFAINNEMINNALSMLNNYYKVQYAGFNSIILDIGIPVKDIKSAVNSIPAITKLLTVLIDSLDAGIIKGMIEVTQEDAVTENFAIYAARLLNNILSNMSQQDAIDVTSSIFEYADGHILYFLCNNVWDIISDNWLDDEIMYRYASAQLAAVTFENLLKKDKTDDVVSRLKYIYDDYSVGIILEDLSGSGGENDFKNEEKLAKYYEKLVEQVEIYKKMAKISLEGAITTLYSKLGTINQAAEDLANLTPVTNKTSAEYTNLMTKIDEFDDYVSNNFESIDARNIINEIVSRLSSYINMNFGLAAPYDFSSATVIAHGQTVSEIYEDAPISKIYKFTPSRNMTLSVVMEGSGVSSDCINCYYIKGDMLSDQSIVHRENTTFNFGLLAGFDYYIVVNGVNSSYSIVVGEEVLPE